MYGMLRPLLAAASLPRSAAIPTHRKIEAFS